MPKPPADRKHGTGDRNDDDVAALDKNLQDRRNAEETKDANEADCDANRDIGIEHP